MSSVAYINNEINEHQFDIDNYYRECENLEIDYRLNTDALFLEREIVGYLCESDRDRLIAESENFVSKLGDLIIKVAKTIIAKIQEYIDRIKNYNFKFKNLKRRYELLERKTNIGNEEIKVICKNGNLDLMSYDKFNDMYEAFEKACQDAEKNVEPTVIAKKFEKVFGKNSTNEDADKAIKMSVYKKNLYDENAALIRMASAMRKYEKDFSEESKKAKNAKDKVKNASEQASKMNGVDPETMKLLNTWFGEMTNMCQQAMSNNSSILKEMESSIEDCIEDNENKETENK